MNNKLFPWFMLISRSALFLIFQALIALVIALTGQSASWSESVQWWPFLPILTNIVCIVLLVYLFRAEGKRFIDLFRIQRSTVKTDLIWFFGSAIIGLPLAAAPIYILADLIFGDRMVPIQMMFIPLPTWAMVVSILFPVTIAFAELPTYFGYSMPRIANQIKNGWGAWLVASLFLALQHGFLPFIPDWRFFMWRVLMYLPFALFVGLLLKLRPSLMPYFVIVHVLMDFSTLSVYYMI